jgi:hypothetical protein
MINVDTADVKELEHALKKMRMRAFPFATKATVNGMAFKTRELAQENIRKNMITRNKWTERSVMVEQARTLRISRQAASTGSTMDYMEVQEFGGTERKKGAYGVVIPTSTASGEGDSARPRTRLVRRANQMSRIQLRNSRSKSTNRAQRNLVAVKQAAASGRKFVFLDTQKHPGIYKIIGGKRKPRVKLIQDMSKTSVKIPANPWLKPAVDDVSKQANGIYERALIFQLKRLGLS